MLTRKSLLILLYSLVLFPLSAQTDFQIVKERVLSEYLEESLRDSEIRSLLAEIKDDGTWPGINYEDVSNTGFEHRHHLSNMIDMSLAYAKSSSAYYQDQILKEKTISALKFWCANDFICQNWWHNQVGTPRALVEVLLLMGDEIPEDLKKQTIEIISRANLEAPGARPGGDRIKIGGIAAKRVLAQGDSSLFKEFMKVINDEIKFSSGDRGIQHDFSFHHRIHRVNNTTSYGLGYAAAFAEWASYVRGTTYAFEDEKIELLVDFYLDGISKLYIYGVYEDPGVLNRDVSRGHSFRPASSSILENLLTVTDYRQEEMLDLIERRKGQSSVKPAYSKFYWQTEHFVCQRPEFYTSVRMYSVRNKNMEQPYNSEGLKNHHKADGASFLSLVGDEYTNIWPVFDWQKIPGASIVQKPDLPSPREIQKDGVSTFVGAVTNGYYGAVGFDFISPHDGMKARKSWFFFDKGYVCLGAGIESDFGQYVATTINQCLLDGKVSVSDDSGRRKLEKGSYHLKDVEWVHHDEVSYIFPGKENLELSNRNEKGSWTSITGQSGASREEVEKEVFKLWINHGERPQGRRGGFENAPMLPKDVTYQYIVAPGTKPKDVDKASRYEIISNSRELQAVWDPESKLVQLIFYQAGSIDLPGEIKLSMDGPAALMLRLKRGKIREITLSDPTRLQGRIHFSVNGKLAKGSSGPFHFQYDRKGGVSYVSGELPSGPYAGSSIHLVL